MYYIFYNNNNKTKQKILFHFPPTQPNVESAVENATMGEIGEVKSKLKRPFDTLPNWRRNWSWFIREAQGRVSIVGFWSRLAFLDSGTNTKFFAEDCRIRLFMNFMISWLIEVFQWGTTDEYENDSSSLLGLGSGVEQEKEEEQEMEDMEVDESADQEHSESTEEFELNLVRDCAFLCVQTRIYLADMLLSPIVTRPCWIVATLKI